MALRKPLQCGSRVMIKHQHAWRNVVGTIRRSVGNGDFMVHWDEPIEGKTSSRYKRENAPAPTIAPPSTAAPAPAPARPVRAIRAPRRPYDSDTDSDLRGNVNRNASDSHRGGADDMHLKSEGQPDADIDDNSSLDIQCDMHSGIEGSMDTPELDARIQGI